MMQASYETSKKIVLHAKQQKALVAFNPSSYQAKQGAQFLKVFLENTDILILNKEEASYLVGPIKIDGLLKGLLQLGPRMVIITDGRAGTYVYDGTWFYHANPKKNLKIVETTGAGDAFASTFLAGLMMKKSVADSIKMGMLNAESIIQGRGAKTNLLERKTLLHQLAKDERPVFRHKI